MKVTKKNGDTAIARRRKKQILEAAADCFRKEGFHRSSMANISAAAGMSSGHIYHYFSSKEGIVEEIVARERSDLGLLVEMTKESMQHTDVITAIADTASASVTHYLDRGNAVLKMEILAEMARNPAITSLVEKYDQEVFQEFYDLLGGRSPDTIARCELASALLEGLSVRAVRNPQLSNILSQELVKKVIRFILTS